MLELFALFLIVAVAGGAAMVVAGLVIGCIIAACVGMLLAVLGVLGLVGKIVFLPLGAMFWVLGHPLLALLLIGLLIVVLSDRRRALI
jgi:hypothetical protein